MSRRLLWAIRTSVAAALGIAAVASPSTAAADQVFSFNGGYFAVRGEDARSNDGERFEVINENLGFLLFDLDDFNGFTFGGEYLIGVGDYLEVGGGLQYYQRSVDSIYADFEDSDGTEVEQTLKLRIIPITANVRFFPIGRNGGIQPYVGGGIGVFNWRYSESGEFIDFDTFEVFRDTFVDKGNAFGGVFIGGVRFPVGPATLVGGEFRYQRASADLDPDLGFAGNEIDLGGYTGTFSVQFRF